MSGFAKVTVLKPTDCENGLIGDFMSLVLAGGEVAEEGLEKRIRSAERLVLLSVCSCLSGISALKRPEQSYRKHVSSRSGVPLPQSEYPFELGWVFVMPSARGRGFSADLTRAALSAAAGRGVFATSRTDNHPMHASLAKFDFMPTGHPYASTRGTHHLQLFLRQAQRRLSAKSSPNVSGR